MSEKLNDFEKWKKHLNSFGIGYEVTEEFLGKAIKISAGKNKTEDFKGQYTLIQFDEEERFLVVEMYGEKSE